MDGRTDERMGNIKFLALGAGQDVGRSCVVVGLGDKQVMFDCGMHMGYEDNRRFPDFSLLSPCGDALTSLVDIVLVSHFHLDHCGALPYLTEQCGYDGPILMSHPTRDLCPLLLSDYRRIQVERKGEAGFYTEQMIKASLAKVKSLRVGERYLCNGLEVTSYLAGHVLGAVMFHVRSTLTGDSVIYSGDYNMTSDRHIGPSSLPLNLRPSLLITESTYASTLREGKRGRERNFLRMIHQTVRSGGKVLIPVFAMGRVQELCLLLDEYWDQSTELRGKVPVYFSAAMAASAQKFYNLYRDWGHAAVSGASSDDVFNFRWVHPLDQTVKSHLIQKEGPMVLFSSPGMLHSGTSLQVFREWAEDPKNLLIIPGFCVSGTVGRRLLDGVRSFKAEEVLGTADINVKMQIKNMSFSAHADAKGMMQLIQTTKPASIVLVHGEKAKMKIFKDNFEKQSSIPVHYPPNGEVLNLSSEEASIPAVLSCRGGEDLPTKIEEAKLEIIDSTNILLLQNISNTSNPNH